jgi:TorA maturation chaperone TorD
MAVTTIGRRDFISEPVVVARVHSFVYGVLAEVFAAPPTPGTVRRLRDIAEALAIACPVERPLSELEREYFELFVVRNPRYVAPHESVFRDRWLVPEVRKREPNLGETGRTIKGVVMDEPTREVRQCYLEAGVLRDCELPDHVANELRFMAHLWAREADGQRGAAPGLAALRERFRQGHLLTWIAALRERVAEASGRGFYTVALEVVEAVLDSDPAESAD